MSPPVDGVAAAALVGAVEACTGGVGMQAAFRTAYHTAYHVSLAFHRTGYIPGEE